jgi:hypothetical protein
MLEEEVHDLAGQLAAHGALLEGLGGDCVEDVRCVHKREST